VEDSDASQDAEVVVLEPAGHGGSASSCMVLILVEEVDVVFEGEAWSCASQKDQNESAYGVPIYRVTGTQRTRASAGPCASLCPPPSGPWC
jgi:pyrimidine deaminase RibD-like protein